MIATNVAPRAGDAVRRRPPATSLLGCLHRATEHRESAEPTHDARIFIVPFTQGAIR